MAETNGLGADRYPAHARRQASEVVSVHFAYDGMCRVARSENFPLDVRRVVALGYGYALVFRQIGQVPRYARKGFAQSLAADRRETDGADIGRLRGFQVMDADPRIAQRLGRRGDEIVVADGRPHTRAH